MHDLCLRKNTQEKLVFSSMTHKKYLEPLYNLLGKGARSSLYINLHTSSNLDSSDFQTLSLDFDPAHRLQVKMDRQSCIQYTS
jgi:hypothetical protein